MEYGSDTPTEALKSKADERAVLFNAHGGEITQYGTFIGTTGNNASNLPVC